MVKEVLSKWGDTLILLAFFPISLVVHEIGHYLANAIQGLDAKFVYYGGHIGTMTAAPNLYFDLGGVFANLFFGFALLYAAFRLRNVGILLASFFNFLMFPVNLLPISYFGFELDGCAIWNHCLAIVV